MVGLVIRYMFLEGYRGQSKKEYMGVICHFICSNLERAAQKTGNEDPLLSSMLHTRVREVGSLADGSVSISHLHLRTLNVVSVP